jgi:uridine kinase
MVQIKMIKIIGISGVSGSGKTTLSRLLGNALKATTLFWDDYDSISEGPSDYVKWFEVSKDCNDWKYDTLAEVLHVLKQGKTLTCPATHRRLLPTEYIIFDAPLGYKHQATGKSIDFLIFLDTPPDIALARRIIRDYSSESNGNNILKEVKNYLLKTRPVYMASYDQKNQSDLILDGSLPLESLLSKVLDGLEKRMK